MSIRVLKLKSNNRANINRVNKKKMLALSYVKRGCCPPMPGTANKVGNVPIRNLSYHNYLKTAHNFKKNNGVCCGNNGKLVKKVKRLTYKRAPETPASSHIQNKKSNALRCEPQCSLPTELICLEDRPIHRGKLACGRSINKISQGSTTELKKVKTYQFVSASDHISSKKAERKKANGDKYDSDLMDNNQC